MRVSGAGLLVIGGAAVIVFWTLGVLLDVADVLPADVARALPTTRVPNGRAMLPIDPAGGLELTIVDGPPTGAARGAQVLLIGLFLGGLPSALVAIGLAAWTRRAGIRWDSSWSTVFLAGFVVQVGSLVVTIPILILLAMALVLWGDGTAIMPSVWVTLSIAAGVRALKDWLALRASAGAAGIVPRPGGLFRQC